MHVFAGKRVKTRHEAEKQRRKAFRLQPESEAQKHNATPCTEVVWRGNGVLSYCDFSPKVGVHKLTYPVVRKVVPHKKHEFRNSTLHCGIMTIDHAGFK